MIGTILRFRYELLEKIGDGFLFAVYRAKDRVQNRIVAVKYVRAPYHENPQLVQSLRQATFATSKLINQSLARVYEFEEHEGVPFLITEFARGANLKDRIRKVAPVSVPVAIDTAIGIAEAVDSAHRMGVLHADLCPQNVIVGMEGNVKVTDFGLTGVYVTSQDVLNMYLGRAVSFLPPEVSQGEAPRVSTDIYSLAIIMYEMLSGELPFSGDTSVAVALQHAQKPIPALRSINPSVPTTVEEMILKAANKQPDLRYSTMSEFLLDLKSVRDSLRFGKPLTWSPSKNLDSAKSESTLLTSAPVAPKTTIQEQIDQVMPTSSVNDAVALPKDELKAPLITLQANDRKRVDDGIQKSRKVVESIKSPEFTKSSDFDYEDTRIPFWLKTLFALGVLVVALGFFFGAGILFFNWTAPKDVMVPNLVGKSRAEAKSELEALNLKMEVARTEYNEKYPPDTLFYESPAANHALKTGSKVEVWLSRGSRKVRVPDVKNMSEDDARKTLEAVELTVASESRKVPSDLLYGSVVSQKPNSGQKIDRGQLVQLTVSNGPADSQTVVNNDQADKMRIFEIDFTIPRGENDVSVRIDVQDSSGVRTAWQDTRPPGDHITQQVTGVGSKVVVKVYADEKLIATYPF